MKKSHANHIAQQLYRLFITRGKTETTQRDYHAVVYPEINCVVVTYCDAKENVKQHTCEIRKSWVY